MDGTPPEQGPPGAEGVRDDATRRAYDERTLQLHEARGALAEAVAALRSELADRRAQLAACAEERERAVSEADSLRGEVTALAGRVAELDAALVLERRKLEELEGTKVVRYTKRPRLFVYRLRARRRG